LPYIAIASVWQKRRPVATDLARYRHRMQSMPHPAAWLRWVR
jgi:hypothetical protein